MLVQPNSLIITELPGANVGFRIWDCACETCGYLCARERIEPGWAAGLHVLELGSGTGLAQPWALQSACCRRLCGLRSGAAAFDSRRAWLDWSGCAFGRWEVQTHKIRSLMESWTFCSGIFTRGFIGFCVVFSAVVTMTDKASILTLTEHNIGETLAHTDPRTRGEVV